MVSTRRSSANAVQATTSTTRSKSIQSVDDLSSTLERGSSGGLWNTFDTSKLTMSTVNASSLDSISEHDLSLTSPSRSKTPTTIMSTPNQQHALPSMSGQTPYSAFHKLAPKQHDVNGSAQNPIVLGNSPISRPLELTKRKRHRKADSQKFMNRGYRELYNYHPSRPTLAPRPADVSTFTGHQGHDIYRMMNAKLGVQEHIPEGPYKHAGHTLPFEVQYPLSAKFLAQHPTRRSQLPSANLQYQHPPAVLRPHPIVPSQNEELLRKKAILYIREYSRPSPRKMTLSALDPDETSSSESELTAMAHPTPIISTTTNKKLAIYHDDSKLPPATTRLAELTSLLTSLLQIYPLSPDQKGLREDIAMLVSVQNQQVQQWIDGESEHARKKRKSYAETAVGGSNASLHIKSSSGMQVLGRNDRDRDEEMRQVLSATASLWSEGERDLAGVFGVGASPTRGGLAVGGGKVGGCVQVAAHDGAKKSAVGGEVGGAARELGVKIKVEEE